MRTSTNVFWILAAFYAFSTVLYAVWSLSDPFHHAIEWAGTIALALLAVMFVFIAFYLKLVHRGQGAELPEDISTANIDDGDPELGHFSPWSWWPIALSAAVALLFLGIAIGFWIAYIGVTLIAITIVGWVYEYYRGYFAR